MAKTLIHVGRPTSAGAELSHVGGGEAPNECPRVLRAHRGCGQKGGLSTAITKEGRVVGSDKAQASDSCITDEF